MTTAWQLVHINTGYGDYTDWYFDKNGGLVVGSSEFSGWLGEFFLYRLSLPSFLLPQHNRACAMRCYVMRCYAEVLMFGYVGGELACDWWRGQPQLMWRFFVSGIALPCSCAQVDLVRDEIVGTG